MCKWWNSFGNTWWAERLGQRPNKGDHLLNIPCLGDTGASGPVRLSVGAGGECGVSLGSSLWSWNMDLLRLHVVVSQLLTKANLVSQSNAMLGIPHFKGSFRFKSSLGKFHEVSFFLLAFLGAKSTAARYQYERHEEEHVDSFDLSMYNMHLLYAHEKTYTFRIDTLTPEDRWEDMMKSEDKLVKVYDPQSRTVMPKRLRDLIANRTPYKARGWCMAEIEWSSTRSRSFQHQKIDRHKDPKESDKDSLKGRVPMSPDDFEEKMRKAQFTHRSDSSQVILLQKKVFHEKADKCEKALFQNLPQGELGKLARSLKYYKTLRALEVLRFECSEDEATLFGKAQQLKNRVVQASLLSFYAFWGLRFWGIFPCLQSFDPEQPFQTGFDSPCKALAEYLAETKTLKTLRIRGQNVDFIVKASWWVREDQYQ